MAFRRDHDELRPQPASGNGAANPTQVHRERRTQSHFEATTTTFAELVFTLSDTRSAPTRVAHGSRKRSSM
jgi:hypothetical protein